MQEARSPSWFVSGDVGTELPPERDEFNDGPSPTQDRAWLRNGHVDRADRAVDQRCVAAVGVERELLACRRIGVGYVELNVVAERAQEERLEPGAGPNEVSQTLLTGPPTGVRKVALRIGPVPRRMSSATPAGLENAIWLARVELSVPSSCVGSAHRSHLPAESDDPAWDTLVGFRDPEIQAVTGPRTGNQDRTPPSVKPVTLNTNSAE